MADQTTRTRKTPKAIGQELAKEIRFDPRALVELKICGELRRIASREDINAEELEERVCHEIRKRPHEAMRRLRTKHALQPPVSDALSYREKAIKALFLKGRDWNKIRKHLQASEAEITVASNSLTRPEILMAKLSRRMVQAERSKF